MTSPKKAAAKKLPITKGTRDIVLRCENELGWTPGAGNKTVSADRGLAHYLLEKKRLTNPRLYSLANLNRAVDWSVKHREPITSPVALCWRVERALEEAHVPDAAEESDDLTARVQAAVAFEQDRGFPDSNEWIGRLLRALGPARAEVLADWKRARRGKK